MFLGPYKRMKDPLVEEFKEMQKKDGKQHRKMLDRAPMARGGVEVEIIDDGHRDWVTQIHFCEKSEVGATHTDGPRAVVAATWNSRPPRAAQRAVPGALTSCIVPCVPDPHLQLPRQDPPRG